MRIAIFGNTNNYPLLLAQGMRKVGVDTRLVVNQRDALHRPESTLFFGGAPYPDWIMDASRLSEEDFIARKSSIGPVLDFLTRNVDGLVLNHLGPSLDVSARLPYIAFLTGSDLLYYASYESAGARTAAWSSSFANSKEGRHKIDEWRTFVKRQRDGIKQARAVSFPWRGLVPKGDQLLDEIGVPSERRFYLFMADTLSLRPAALPANPKLRILNGARIVWRKPLPPGLYSQDDKGTDVLIYGFAKYSRAGARAELRLIKKGVHVPETVDLVRQLGIEDAVVWLDEMPIHRFHEEMQAADVVCDQFGASFPGMVGNDAMALGRPVVANVPSALQRYYPERIPIFHASTPDEVAAHFQALSDHQTREDAGDAGRAFMEKWCSPEQAAATCINYLRSPRRKDGFDS